MKSFLEFVAFLLIAGNVYANSYVQPLQCQATSIALNSPSTSATVQCPSVPPPPTPSGVCKTIPSATAGIARFNRWSGTYTVNLCANGCGKQADVTSFNSIYGTWPGQYGLIAYLEIPTSAYASLGFTVPANYMTAANRPAFLYGAYKVGETGASTTQGITISTTCGDFSNPATNPTSTVVPGCWKNNSTSGNNLLTWRSDTTCVLKGGQPYYLNIINADISNAKADNTGALTSTRNSRCGPSACQTPIMDGPGSWSGYKPNP